MKLKLATAVLTVLLWPMLAVAQPPERPHQVEALEEPEIELPTHGETVRGFLNAFEQGKLSLMWKYVLGAQPGQQLPASYSDFQKHQRIEIKSVEVSQNLDQAIVSVRVQFFNNPPALEEIAPSRWQEVPAESLSSLLMLQRDGMWKIIPVASQAVGELKDNPLLLLASLVLYPEAAETLRQEAIAASSLNNLKQLGLAVRMLSQDHDYKIVLPKENCFDQLIPYAGTKAVFYLPMAEPKKQYAFNSLLSGVFEKDIKELDQTVLFYTGQNGQLDFLYQDRAAVVFVLGNAKLVTREEAKALRWKP